MLKIERERSTALTFSPKEGFFSRIFLKAFIVAFSIHAIGLVLFKIKPIHFSGNRSIFSSVSVEADPESSSSFSLEADAYHEQKRKYQLLPEVPEPEISLISEMFIQQISIVQKMGRNPFDLPAPKATQEVPEDMLRGLHFQANPEGFMTSGEIEFTFRVTT